MSRRRSTGEDKGKPCKSEPEPKSVPIEPAQQELQTHAPRCPHCQQRRPCASACASDNQGSPCGRRPPQGSQQQQQQQLPLQPPLSKDQKIATLMEENKILRKLVNEMESKNKTLNENVGLLQEKVLYLEMDSDPESGETEGKPCTATDKAVVKECAETSGKKAKGSSEAACQFETKPAAAKACTDETATPPKKSGSVQISEKSVSSVKKSGSQQASLKSDGSTKKSISKQSVKKSCAPTPAGAAPIKSTSITEPITEEPVQEEQIQEKQIQEEQIQDEPVHEEALHKESVQCPNDEPAVVESAAEENASRPCDVPPDDVPPDEAPPDAASPPGEAAPDETPPDGTSPEQPDEAKKEETEPETS